MVNVLVVEDDVEMQSRIVVTLRESSREVSVSVAGSVESAMASVSARRPDFLVLDLRLPDGSALDVIRRVRATDADATLVVFGANLSAQHRAAVLASGGDGCVDKAEGLGAVLGLLQVVVRAQRSQRTLERYRAIVETDGEGIVLVDAAGTVVHATPEEEALLGYSASEVVGRSMFELLHPDDTAPARCHLAELLADPLVRVETERRFRHKDGSWRWLQVACVNRLREDSLEALVVRSRDVTTTYAAMHDLAESRERFRELAENIPEVFWVTSPLKNRMEYISPGYERVWGRSVESLLATPRSWIDAIHPDDRERVIAALPSQLDGTYDVEYRIVRPDGSIRMIHDRAYAVRDGSNAVVRVVGLAEDVTERRLLEERLRHSVRLEMLGRLSGGIVHDFRNLLTVMRTSAQFVAESLGDPDVPKELALLRETIERGIGVTRRLLSFGRSSDNPRGSDAGAVVRDAVSLLTRHLGADLLMVVEVDEGLPPVQLPAADLEQVLSNLLFNARDAMPKGGRIRLRVSTAAPGRVEIRVEDEGVGIPPEIQAHLFEPFFTTKGAAGTGLGLSTVRTLVEASGGTVRVTSEPQRGTTVVLDLLGVA